MGKQIEPRRRASQTETDQPDDQPSNAERIWQVVASIPAGRVATYGQVAALAGLPGGARLVGHTLSKLPRGSKLPWHRVLNAKGELSFPRNTTSWRRQKNALRDEGVPLKKGRLSLRQYRWEP